MEAIMSSIRSILGALLACSLLAQDPGRLQIRVLAGEGALNNIKRKLAHNPEVVVNDADGRPVAGATVVFTFPFSGPSASVAGGRKFQGQTNDDGRITVVGMTPNEVEGRFVIAVEASKDGLTGRTVIPQSNTLAGGREEPGASGGNRKLWIGILALAGGGAAVGMAATRGGGSGSGSAAVATGTSLSVGSVTVGGPR
jgi:hypothetical protein